MSNSLEETWDDAIVKLKQALASLQDSDLYNEIILPRDDVLGRYGSLFSPEGIANLTEDEFKSFLLFENNHHWTSLHRQGPRICADMTVLRSALTELIDETRPIEERINHVNKSVTGMGKSTITAILLVTFPEKYGVWNDRSEPIMKRMEIWPSFERGESLGDRYVKINSILLDLCRELQCDLWTLDALWVLISREEESITETVVDEMAEQTFRLEQYLHEFIRDNWDSIDIFNDWSIYREPGDDEKIAGYKYPCSAGEIDILARHRNGKDWMVIELKRNQTGDTTVGQILRYIGWVKKNLMAEGESIYGMIICREGDEKLQYAVSTLDNITIWNYSVKFSLAEQEFTV